MNITLNLTGTAPDEMVLAEMLHELAGRLERGEIRRDMRGALSESCLACNESAEASWELTSDGEAESGDEDDGSMTIETPFGTMHIVPLTIN